MATVRVWARRLANKLLEQEKEAPTKESLQEKSDPAENSLNQKSEKKQKKGHQRDISQEEQINGKKRNKEKGEIADQLKIWNRQTQPMLVRISDRLPGGTGKRVAFPITSETHTYFGLEDILENFDQEVED